VKRLYRRIIKITDISRERKRYEAAGIYLKSKSFAVMN